MNILISEINIVNFRSIKNQNMVLSYNNFIVGKNNSGKSNFIKAVQHGITFSEFTKDDIYASESDPYNENKGIFIDVLFRPVQEKVISKDFNEAWSLIIGTAKQYDSIGNAYFGMRTHVKFDGLRSRYITKKSFIRTWSKDYLHVTLTNDFTKDIYDNIVCVFLDAQRDIAKDITDRKSIWSRLTADITIDVNSKTKIENQLKKINSSLINHSEILKSIKTELKNTTSESKNTIELNTITCDIESLYKGMNIFYSGENQSAVSVDNVGLGVRSWAVFSTIKALNKINHQKAYEIDEEYFPVILIEEPEAHIHPQAQRTIVKEILSLGGQIFVSTHSPYIFQEANFDEIGHVDLCNGESQISKINLDGYKLNYNAIHADP